MNPLFTVGMQVIPLRNLFSDHSLSRNFSECTTVVYWIQYTDYPSLFCKFPMDDTRSIDFNAPMAAEVWFPSNLVTNGVSGFQAYWGRLGPLFYVDIRTPGFMPQNQFPANLRTSYLRMCAIAHAVSWLRMERGADGDDWYDLGITRTWQNLTEEAKSFIRGQIDSWDYRV